MRKSSILAAVMTAAMSLAQAASAADVYTSAPLDVNGTTSGDFLGTLDVATPVAVLETKGDQTKVRVSGWALKEYPSQIFKEAGLRIQYASFDEEGAVKLDPKGGEKTVQGNVWQKASAEGWVPTKSLTKDIAALWAAGEKRHKDACSSCHPAPHANHFTANQWASQLPERGGRTGHSRRGNNAVMFKWLQANAKPL